MRRHSTPPPPGRIRVIGGNLRRSRIDVPAAPGLRPTPDRVRETLFNWLAPVIDGARCLDLFAGSGANGIEAASRGAARVEFVERDPALARHLSANLARLGVGVGAVTAADALTWLDGSPRAFDVVFMDPPFSDAEALATAAAQKLEQRGWLAPEALIHVESPVDSVFALPDNWRIHREGRAGVLRYTLYQRAKA